MGEGGAGLLAKESVLVAGPIVLLLAVRARARATIALLVIGAPTLYLMIHRTSWIASGALRAILIAFVVGFGPSAVAAALGWRSTIGGVRLWAVLLIPIMLASSSPVTAFELAYWAVVLFPVAAQRTWSRAGAFLTLGATPVSAIGVQKMSESWLQVLACAAIIVLYAILAPRRPF